MPFVPGPNMVQVKRPRPGPRGVIKPGKGFNHFPAIIAAFPDAVSGIVVESTELLGSVAQALAPTQHDNLRPGHDPVPGTLKKSKRTRYYRRRATDMVVSGRVDFTATDPRGHRYPKPLETGSWRPGRVGKVTKGSGWLVDAIVAVRRVFVRNLGDLESRLPH
jgi:hypothetical protein